MGMYVRLVKRFKKKLMSFYLSKTKKTVKPVNPILITSNFGGTNSGIGYSLLVQYGL